MSKRNATSTPIDLENLVDYLRHFDAEYCGGGSGPDYIAIWLDRDADRQWCISESENTPGRLAVCFYAAEGEYDEAMCFEADTMAEVKDRIRPVYDAARTYLWAIDDYVTSVLLMTRAEARDNLNHCHRGLNEALRDYRSACAR